MSRLPRLNLRRPNARIPEIARQNAVLTVVRLLGYTVFELGQKKQPVICSNCRTLNWQKQSTNTTGTPDLAVTHETRWIYEQAGHIVGLLRGWEMKAPDTAVRPEQARLAELGVTTILWDEWDAVYDIIRVEHLLGLTLNPKIERFACANGKQDWLADVMAATTEPADALAATKEK